MAPWSYVSEYPCGHFSLHFPSLFICGPSHYHLSSRLLQETLNHQPSLGFHPGPISGYSQSIAKVSSFVLFFFKLNSHNINYFKVNNSVAFSTLTVLCNHHHFLVLKHFYHPQRLPNLNMDTFSRT